MLEKSLAWLSSSVAHLLIISSNDFPFKTDGAALTSGAPAVVWVVAGAVEVDPKLPVPSVDEAVVEASPGFGVVGAPNKPVLGVVWVVAALSAPKLNKEGGVVVSPVEVEVAEAFLSPGCVDVAGVVLVGVEGAGLAVVGGAGGFPQLNPPKPPPTGVLGLGPAAAA
jgi:hypothetical protein